MSKINIYNAVNTTCEVPDGVSEATYRDQDVLCGDGEGLESRLHHLLVDISEMYRTGSGAKSICG